MTDSFDDEGMNECVFRLLGSNFEVRGILVIFAMLVSFASRMLEDLSVNLKKLAFISIQLYV